ncbi:response regulator [Dyadobacter diqingensis]|uniref:response regulator n=1 Tax=Dyadobacter diqingensis TaxID=2938121 RepID=UPI0020C1CCCC|nr:response regulator transcription factor [Dyadobacter diqingensis]
MTNVLIIDRHPILRKGLSLFLKEHFRKITILEANTLTTFEEIYLNQKVDLLIIGINQNPGFEGVHEVIELRKRFAETALIIYDENPKATLILEYLKTGIDGYLGKQNGLEELLECINYVTNGNRYLSNSLLAVMLNGYEEKIVAPEKTRVTLTSREYKIAKLLSQGMKTSKIAEMLNRKSSTISTVKKTIFKKLGVENVVQLKEIF